ncbi:MAG: hypothetical protein HQL08_00930 [Nitrospirae bacterium]|nr:hypothetical protein [Nitrospirota bacterium]
MRAKYAYLKRIISSYFLHYNSSNLKFWHTTLRVNVISEEHRKSLHAYPQNYEDKVGLITTLDEQGVIMLDYKGDLGLQYNPNAIAQLALGYYDKVLSGEDCKADFLTQAAFFLDHGRLVEDDVLLWEYTFPFEMRNYLTSPWRSALAQGQGISVCLRAYQFSNDDRYLHAAHKAFNSFKYLAHRHPGGVLNDFRGYVWLEEYIVEPPNHVLNGLVWALWGIRDYALFFNDPYARELWDSCVRTLIDNLRYYDLGFWTSYDLVKFNGSGQPTMPSSIYYQKLHVVQMQAMYALTGEDVFRRFAERWNGQLHNPIYRVLSQAWKIYFKLKWF